MNVRNCRKCGIIFNYVMGPIVCPRCKEEQENKFQEVKKYVQDNRGADIHEVATECDVDPSQIRQWIREERLEFSADSPVQIACEKCGEMIRSGRFCEKCKNSMANQLNSSIQKKEAPRPQPKKDSRDNPKMRFLG